MSVVVVRLCFKSGQQSGPIPVFAILADKQCEKVKAPAALVQRVDQTRSALLGRLLGDR